MSERVKERANSTTVRKIAEKFNFQFTYKFKENC